jgi:hypothetical protein
MRFAAAALTPTTTSTSTVRDCVTRQPEVRRASTSVPVCTRTSTLVAHAEFGASPAKRKVARIATRTAQ